MRLESTHLLDECWNFVDATNGLEHADNGFIGPAMERAVKSSRRSAITTEGQ